MSEAIPPLPFRWDGEALVPLNQHWAKRADAAYTIGETYTLVPHEERSANSHRHYFASVREAWEQLPEDVSRHFPTPEHLRKHALIQTGFRDERSIVCASKSEARRVAAFVSPMDDYAAVVIHEAMVVVMTAKSQNLKAMDRRTFADSKDKVLALLDEMVGVSAGMLSHEAGRAA